MKVLATVKLMAENTQVALEEVVNVDIGPLMLAMVRRLARCFGSSGQRLRIRYCNLSETIGCRSDNISLRIDSATRHEILDFILQWMTPPATVVCGVYPHVEFLILILSAAAERALRCDRARHELFACDCQTLRSIRVASQQSKRRLGQHGSSLVYQIFNGPSKNHRESQS